MVSLKYIIIPISVAIVAQMIKTIIEIIKTKKINLLRLLDGMGGMPSVHSALVSSLTTLIYLNYNISSVMFSITLIFSLIVIYDSMGIRYESGSHAKVLNRCLGTNLNEKLGHKPIEVLIGVLLGIILTILINKII